MTHSLPELEKRRAQLLAQISQLADFRPGSITATQGRCGNLNCHCHQPGHPGHGPNLRLTYKVEGKTVTESFATPAAQRGGPGHCLASLLPVPALPPRPVSRRC